MKRAQEGSSSSSPPGTEIRAHKVVRRQSGPAASAAPPRKVIRCTVHESICLEPLLVQIVDTSHYQRLRSLKQLGTTPKVYPCATHTRFDHSLGVATLAEQLCRSIADHPMPAGVEKPTERDILCVKIAALCHDLGHGPYSHVFDGHLVPLILGPGKHKHEELSVRLLHCLLKEHQIDLGQHHASDGEPLDHHTDLSFIAELILGDDLPGGVLARKGRNPEKAYLYDIVSNVDSGLDVDKLDYLQRDPRMTGNAPPQFKVDHLFDNAQVRMSRFDGEPKPRPTICFAAKVKTDVLGVFQTRYIMHKKTYTHKVSVGYELLLVDYLTSADALGTIYPRQEAGKVSGGLRLGDTVREGNEKAFLKMTDDNLLLYYDQLLLACEDALQSKPESSAKSAEKLELARVRRLQQRVDARLPYRCIGERKCDAGSNRKEQEEAIASCLRRANLTDAEFHIELQHCHYGKKAKNPALAVRFFKKNTGPDDEAKSLREKDFDDADLPKAFESKRFRAFFKGERSDPKYAAAVAELSDDSDEECEDDDVGASQEPGIEPPAD